MNSDNEWNHIRNRAGRRFPADFSAAVVREAVRRRAVETRLRSALLTTVILFVAVTVGASWSAARASERSTARHNQYAWAKERMGIDL